MLYRFVLTSFIIAFLALTCAYIKVGLEARLLWANEQPYLYIEIHNTLFRFKRSRQYTAEDFTLPVFTDIPFSLSSISLILSRLNRFKQLPDLLLRHLIIQRLEWKSVLGCGDAMGTALANGTLWGIKGFVAAGLSSKSRVMDLNLLVRPDFSQKYFESQLHCIFKIRIVHIIFVTTYILAQMAKARCSHSCNNIKDRRG